jgi:dCTP deaminase
MSALTSREITEWMDAKKRSDIKKRLIITPLINPKESIGASSVDVRLGNKFILMRRQSFPVLDIKAVKESSEDNIAKFQQSVRCNYGEPFVIHPHQLVIGSTFEYVSIPGGLMCYVIGKSSWGRMGLIIATATKVDPGFRGCITLEIVNEGEIPVKLYPGLPIAQLVFHVTLNEKDVYKGKYSCPIGPEFPIFDSTKKDWQFWMSEKRK